MVDYYQQQMQHRSGGWGNSQEIGKLYLVSKEDNKQVGMNWMHGRLMDGDVILCIKSTGDQFCDYYLVEPTLNTLQIIEGTQFGAYPLGKLASWQPNKEELKTLLNGDRLFLESDEPTTFGMVNDNWRLRLTAK